jgi:hypothetical protein
MELYNRAFPFFNQYKYEQELFHKTHS